MNKGRYIKIHDGEEFLIRTSVGTPETRGTFFTYKNNENAYFQFNHATEVNNSFYSKGTDASGNDIWIKLIEK